MTDSSNSPSPLASLLPFLSVLKQGGSNSDNSSGGFQRTVGMAATLGLSLAILRFVVSAINAANEHHAGENSDDDDHNNSNRAKRDAIVNELLNRSEVLYEFVRTILRRMILQGQQKRKLEQGGSDDEDSEDEDNAPILHKGSCHCRSVCFELIAPRKVKCKEAIPGKIQYRHARVRARSFRFVKGTHLVKMYYVNKSSSTSTQTTNNGNEEVGAHSFCSHCGVNLLHAPNSHSTALDVNVDCLNQNDIKLKVMPRKKGNLSAGYAVAGQWEHEQENSTRYPATIAEENSPMVMFPITDKRSPFSAYQHHPLMRDQNQQFFDAFEDDEDDTVNLVYPGGGEKIEPATPSTVHTSQTESFLSSSHSGVPPTLTLDTRDCSNDTESVVSLSSSRSCFLSSGTTSFRAQSSGPLDSSSSVGAMQSDLTSGSLTPTTTPLVRHQMQYYMRKHMASSSSLPSSTLNTPKAKDTAIQKTKKIPSFSDAKREPEKIRNNM